MEGAKSAMYAQAGRSHSWSKVQSVADEAVSLRTKMPAPPVVEVPDFMPEFADTGFESRLDAANPQEKCQELAIAYVKMQRWQELYETEQGFARGTIFAELDLPFTGKGACKSE